MEGSRSMNKRKTFYFVLLGMAFGIFFSGLAIFSMIRCFTKEGYRLQGTQSSRLSLILVNWIHRVWAFFVFLIMSTIGGQWQLMPKILQKNWIQSKNTQVSNGLLDPFIAFIISLRWRNKRSNLSETIYTNIQQMVNLKKILK